MGSERVQSPQKDGPDLARHEKGEPPEKESSGREAQRPEPGLALSGVDSPPGAPLTQSRILRLQRTIGNRAVARMLQRKVALSHPNDASEREADRVAEQVIRPPDVAPQPARPGATTAVGRVQKMSLASSVKPLQREAAPDAGQAGQANDGSLEAAQNLEGRLGGGGSPLPDGVRSFMEPKFGADLSQVRVHTGGEAAQMSASLNAEAFTYDRNIYFGAGRAPANDALTAHELTHVVQQRAAPVDAGAVEPAGSPAEREAASAATSGGAPLTLTATPRGLSRDVGWAQRPGPTQDPTNPIPDAYGLGYNTILTNAGLAARPSVLDLASLEDPHMDVDLTKFAALPGARMFDVLALEPHAVGTGCEPWFPKMRAQLQKQPLSFADPYGGPATGGSSTTVTAHFFPGRTDRRALVIGGVHNETEQQGAEVVGKLRTLLDTRAAAGKLPFFTVILVPNLFDRSRYAKGDRWVKGGTGLDKTGTLSKNRSVEPNRNYPLPGEDLAAARARGAASANDPELVFTDPANPTAAPRAAHDTSIAGGGGTSIRMLPETRTLISLIEHFHPERIASIHAHSLKKLPGDAPGIFVDPRGVNPTTGAVTDAAQAAEDDRLAAAMVREGRSRLGSTPIAGAPSDPFVGNVPPTGSSTVRYASGVHAEGNSLGTWAPVPVATGAGARAGITTVTVEVPQWKDPKQATQLGQIEDLDSKLLADIFLEDPATVTPATAPTKP